METLNTTTQTNDRVRQESTKGALEITRVYKSDWQKEGTESAEIKQTIETKSFYPSKSVSNDMQDNIFATEDFGFAEQEFLATETRVAWIDVPLGTAVDAVKEQLTKFPNATIYKVLSNKPVLTSDQKYAVANGITTLDGIGDRQAVRYSEKHDVADLRGKLILDNNGKIQYRQTYFSKVAKGDIDARTADAEDVYMSANLKAELEATGQVVI